MAEITSSDKKGRPRVKVATNAILELYGLGYGYKRIARIMNADGDFVSASTVARHY